MIHSPAGPRRMSTSLLRASEMRTSQISSMAWLSQVAASDTLCKINHQLVTPVSKVRVVVAYLVGRDAALTPSVKRAPRTPTGPSEVLSFETPRRRTAVVCHWFSPARRDTFSSSVMSASLSRAQTLAALLTAATSSRPVAERSRPRSSAIDMRRASVAEIRAICATSVFLRQTRAAMIQHRTKIKECCVPQQPTSTG